MRDSQSLHYLALALPECLPPSFPEDVTTDLKEYKNLAPCETWKVPVDYENLHKERVPLGDGRLRPAVSRRPASAGQPRSRTRRGSVDQVVQDEGGAWKSPGRRSKPGVGTTCGAKTVTPVLGEEYPWTWAVRWCRTAVEHTCSVPQPKWWSKTPDDAEGVVHRRAGCPTECPYVPAQIWWSGT